MNYGAAVDAQDYPNGNTILHLLVEQGVSDSTLAKETFESVLKSTASQQWYSLKNCHDPAKWTSKDDTDFKTYMLYIENNDGYTPLTLAAKIGAHEMLDFIMNIEGVYLHTAWCFGNISFAGYDMAEIDPIIADRVRPGKPNVLELLAYRKLTEEALPAFFIPIIGRLISCKWEHHRYQFAFWVVLHSLLIGMSYKVPVIFLGIHNNIGNMTSLNNTNIEIIDILKHSNTLIFFVVYLVVVTFVNIILEINDVGRCIIDLAMKLTRKWHKKMYNAPLRVILKIDLFRVLLLVSSILQISSLSYLLVHFELHSFLFSPAFITSCTFCLFFLHGFQMTGYFSTVIHQIVLTDIVSFAFVFSIILVGFGGTMAIISFDLNDLSGDFHSVKASMYTLFFFMLGFGTTDLNSHKNRDMARFIIIVFACLTIILFMNMLIAAMSETYTKLAPYKHHISRWNRLTAILMIHRKFPRAKAFCKKLTHDPERDKWLLSIETTVPPTCI